MQSQQSGTVPQKQIDVGSHYVNNKYTLIHKMHEGMNSKIFVGAFMKNNRQVTRAIKIQYNSRQATSNGVFGQGTTKNDKNGGIRHQIHVLRTLFTNQYGKVQIKTGFPHTFEFGQQKNSNYIVMGMYGPNLGQLMKLCGGKFSARTTLLLSLQIMDRLQDLHNKKYLYGNMNPQNFLIGINKQSYLLFMIDFSKATIYKSKTKNVHIPYQQTNNCQNPSYDTTFMSLNSHLGVQASRRDDIQSFMYLILYMFKGRLPWIADNSYGTNGGHAEDQQQIFNLDIKRDQTINSLNLISGGFTSLQEQRSKVLEIKRRLSPESLFKNFSFELIDLMYYIRTLSFYEKPDYQYIRKKLWNALYQTDYQQLRNNIIIYDWNQREPLDYQIYRDEPKFKLKSDKEKQKDDVMDNDNASDKGSDQCLKSKETGSKNSSRDLVSSSGGKKGKKDKKRTSLASENKNISSNQELKSSLFKQDKKKQDKILQQDDANVVEDEDDFNDEVDQQTLSKIDEKLKLVRKLDESKMSQSLYKDGAQKKGNSNAVQSRFKQCSSQKGLKQ